MTKRILSFILAFALLVTSIGLTTIKPIESQAEPTCYQQGDSRWGGTYVGNWTMAASGCGILSAVNAVNYLTGNFIDPVSLGRWAYQNNHFNGSYGQGTMRNTLYPAFSTAYGPTYGFTISGLQYGSVTSSALINHLKNGGVAIVHVPNHFMALCGYNTSTGQYLVYDSAANVTNRGTYPYGTWLTAAQLNSKTLSVIDWFCLMTRTGPAPTNPPTTTYSLTAKVASGQGTVHFGNNVTSTTVGAGTIVNYQVTPASGWQVSQVLIYGTKQNVAAAGGVYQFKMEAAAATVSVTFTQIAAATYTLTASVASGSGTVHFGNGVTTVQPTVGQVVNFQVTPASGWTTSEILVGGTAWEIKNGGGDCVYQVTMPAGNCGIVVKFVQNSFKPGVYEIASSDGVMSVRTKPVDGTVLAEIKNGTRITALEITNTYWAKILYKGQIAYVSIYSSYAKYINSNTIAESDIVFDSSKEATWVKNSGLNASSVALGKCPSGDAAMVVKTTSATNDPQINLDFSVLGTLSATDYKYMIITAKTTSSNTAAKMYLCPGTITGATEDCATSWAWTNDGLWHDYIINLSAISTWKGNLNRIRFDFFDGDTVSGATLYLRSIRFLTAAPSSPKVTTDKTTYLEGETITANYSGLGSYNSPIQNQIHFVGLYKKGQKPGAVGSLYWATTTSTSGSIKFPSGANAGGGLTSAGLTPGEYTMWIAYDGNGSASSANLNNAMFGSSGTSYDFTIAPATYTVSASVAGGSGTVHFGSGATTAQVGVGTEVNFQTTPATGYKVSKILVNGTSVTIQNGGADCVYQFSMPAQNTTVEVTFTKLQYAVSVGTVSNGKVTLSKTGNVDYGTTITVTATPNTGYKLNQILVNGTAISGTTFTVTAASTVTATFTKLTYKVSVGTVSNGTVTLSKTGTVDYGTTITVTATPATGYKLDKILVNGTAITGTTFTVTEAATVTATFTAISYNVTSSITGKGTVTFGTATSTTAATDSTVSYTVTPTAGYKVTSIKVNGTAVTISNATAAATYTFTMPAKATTVAVTFTAISYNVTTSVTSGSGTVTLSNGSTSGTAATDASVKYTVTPDTGYKVSTIKVNGTSITVTNSGATATYTLTMPAKDTTIAVTFAKIQYAVSVGTVSNGKVTLSKTGNVDYGTTITVTATPNTGYKLNQILVNGTAITGTTFTVTEAATVTATFTAIPYNVTIEVSSGSGTAAFADGTTAKTATIGQSVSYTLTPATGYKVSKITVNGTSVSVTNSGATATYTLTMTAAETTISVTFAKKTYAVSVGDVTNGTVTLSSTGNISYNTTITVTAIPNEGYELESILVNGTAISGNTFKVTKASTVTATFKKIQYAVSAGTVSNGSIKLSATGNVDYGTTITVTATPATGYKLDKILVNGTAITGTTFTVTAASEVTATFTKLTYAVSVGTVSNGTVKLSKTGTVDYGTTITVTATPATGYKLDKILVNGTAITGTTFTVTGASEVTATFTKLTYSVSVGTVSNGTVKLSKTGAVEYGTTITVTATAADGYELNEILVNGSAITGTTFTVTADAVVTATFTEKVVEVETYTITIVKGGKGTGTVTVVESAEAGTAITLTATGTVNASGYACVTTAITSSDATLTTSQAVTGAYTGATFTMPAKNVTITVNFQLLGDVDLNGAIAAKDVALLKRASLSKMELSAEAAIAANVAGKTNTSLVAKDIALLKRLSLNSAYQLENGTY